MLYLDKLLTQIAYPLSLSLLPLLLLWRHWRRSGLTILVLAVAWLWVWSLPVVVVSGGVAWWRGERRPEAEVSVQFLRALGVPERAMLLESDSRDRKKSGTRS